MNSDNIQIIKTSGSFLLNVKKDEKHVSYQSLESVVNEFNLHLEENASLELLTFNNGSTNSVKLNAHLEKGAHLTVYNMIISGKDVEVVEEIYLEDASADANVLNVCLGYDKAVVNSLIHIFHTHEYTNSELETYAIALDEALLTLDNNATIKQGCKKSVAHQKAKGLNLSPNSTIKAQPNLYIDEYDVMASHGVAMGSLNKDDLFYLMSRGLTVEEASHIVIMGFIEPILVAIDNEELTNTIREQFKQNLE